jgi:deoxyribose-phosphate aldolase
MKHELVCLENKWEEINKFLFYAIENNLDNISIPAQTTKNITDLFGCDSKCSAIISYPIGSSEPQVKLHEVMLCTSRNIKKIDYTINVFDLENFNIRAILSELKSAYQICKDKRATLRPILEYKFLSYQDIITLINGIASIGIEEMIIGTGYSVDNYQDNMIVSRFIQDKFSINIISSAPIICQEQYDEVHKNKIFGVRIKSYKLLDNLCIK